MPAPAREGIHHIEETVVKKLFSLCLALAFAMTTVGCADAPKPKAPDKAKKEEPKKEEPKKEEPKKEEPKKDDKAGEKEAKPK
ncbi:MAG: hypothetical protein K1X57_04965 [Gemmataceae bacterium]|nr:hypothetical protein [Gemmataceae bacterium]